MRWSHRFHSDNPIVRWNARSGLFAGWVAGILFLLPIDQITQTNAGETRTPGEVETFFKSASQQLEVAQTIPLAAPVSAIAISNSGRFVVIGGQTGAAVYSLPDLHLKASLNIELEAIHDLKFNTSGDRLAVAGGVPGQLGRVEILDWQEKSWWPILLESSSSSSQMY